MASAAEADPKKDGVEGEGKAYDSLEREFTQVSGGRAGGGGGRAAVASGGGLLLLQLLHPPTQHP